MQHLTGCQFIRSLSLLCASVIGYFKTRLPILKWMWHTWADEGWLIVIGCSSCLVFMIPALWLLNTHINRLHQWQVIYMSYCVKSGFKREKIRFSLKKKLFFLLIYLYISLAWGNLKPNSVNVRESRGYQSCSGVNTGFCLSKVTPSWVHGKKI